MKTQELKSLIKEAVREVLKEELAELGKQKIQESIASPEAWPTVKFDTNSVNPALRQSLMDQMGIPAPKPINASVPKTFGEKQMAYQDILKQTAASMMQNPADVNNFRNIQ